MLKIQDNLQIIDERNPFDIIFNYAFLSVTYTLKTDDITKGEKPGATPYVARVGEFQKVEHGWYNQETKTSLVARKDGDGLRLTMKTESDEISEWGLNMPFNFQGKKYGGGWKNQFLLNSPYITNDRKFKSFYLTKVNGAHLLVVVLSNADGWKMDYSPYLGGSYFYNFKVLANFDRAFGEFEKKKELVVGVYPVEDYEDALALMAKKFNVPFMYANYNAGEVGKRISLQFFEDCDSIIEKSIDGERKIDKSNTYEIQHEQDTELIPCYKGVRGAGITIYGYKNLIDLYKKSMDTVDLDVIKNTTDSNLCEHQCWASAMLRFLKKYKDKLTANEVEIYEGKLKSLLDRVTETNEEKAEVRLTIFDKPHADLPAYNVYKSKRIQEQYFGITLLLDAYQYFKDEKYLKYAVNSTDCLLDNYQKQDGRLETSNCRPFEDYTAVCSPMIPLADMAKFLKGKDDVRAKRYEQASDKICEYLYRRGYEFNTEGGDTDKAEKRVSDGGLACTILTILYYCKNVKKVEKYLKFAKDVLDIHENWVMRSPISQIRNSSLRWWETKWEGDADGPAFNCGHGWTIWRAECDWLYYELTGDVEYRNKAINGFNTNFAKINEKGETFATYNVDDINGGGFHSVADEICFKIASKFPKQTDSGLSRYVWIRVNDCLLKN